MTSSPPSTDVISRDSPLWTSFSKSQTADAMQAYYDEWAATYDSDVATHDYNGPKYLLELATKHIDKSAYILCIGAGTGLEGQALKTVGYGKMDAHDGSEAMLEIARKRGIFVECIHELMQPEPAVSAFVSDRYDAWVCVGCFVAGGLDERHLPDMLRPLKKGGIGIIGTREIFTRPIAQLNITYDLEKRIETMVADGVIELVERRRYDNYSEKMAGIFYVIRKM